MSLALCMLAVLVPVFCPWELVLTLLLTALFPPIAFSNCTVVYVNDVEKKKRKNFVATYSTCTFMLRLSVCM